jgi:uncharacterized protein YuzE
MITLSIDTNVDAAYFELTDEPVVETVEVSPCVQVDIDATGTVVGIELLSLAAKLPLEALDGFKFPYDINPSVLSQAWPSFSYHDEGQGRAHSFPELQLA